MFKYWNIQTPRHVPVDAFFPNCPNTDKRVARSTSRVFSRRRRLCATRNRIADRASVVSPKNNTSTSFCRLKCSSQTAAGACASPRVSRPCLDLVYLVFHQNPESRRRNERASWGRKGREEEEDGGYLCPLPPLHCAL